MPSWSRAGGPASRGRRALAWLVTLSLVLIGSQVAHALSYRIVYPESELRWRELLASGHGYLAYEPLVLACVAACAVVSLLVLAADEVRGNRPQPLPAWAFALLPPLAFTAQELLERALAGAGLRTALLEQTTFRVGLALQLPCALAAYVAARLLLRAAVRVGLWLDAVPRRRLPPTAAPAIPRLLAGPRPSPLAFGRCERGPPLVSF
jgi:hypothetical protein